MKFISDKKIKLFLFLTIGALVSILIISYYNFQELKSSGDLVEHTQDVLKMNDNVLMDVLNIETGSRGYVLTGNELFLKPYNDAISVIGNDLKSLADSTRDNSRQQNRIDALKKVVNERMALTKGMIESRKNNKLNESEKISIIEKGKANTDNIRDLISGINSEEFDLLKQRKSDNEKSSTYLNILFLLLIVFFFVIILLVIIIFNNHKISDKNQERIAHLATIVEYSDDAIISKSLDGTIKSWNNGAEKMFGHEAKQVIGKNISLIFPKESIKERLDILKRVSNNEIIDHYETVRIKKNGDLINVSITVSPLKDSSGKITGISKIARDVTEQKKASQYARNLIEASLDPLVTINTDGKITDMNLATANITGLTREKLTGTDFFEYFTEPQKAREVYKEVFAKGFVADSPLTIRHKNGKLTDVLFNGSVYKDDNGKVIGVVIVARDSTAQKLLSNYSLSLIEASRDPLFTISPFGKITDLNQATVRVTGISREELIGSNFFDYFTKPEKAREGYHEIFAKGFVADYPLTIMDGKLTDVLFNGSVYKDDRGNVLGAVVVARDITEQKIIENELTEAKVFAELATELAEGAKIKAESATRIAVDAVKAKQQFLSNMSHEIRTPMNAIIGFTKVVLKTDLSAKQKEYLTAIKMSGDALIVLINDILDLAKVDAGKMTFEQTPFKMELSIAAMLHLFETKIQEKNLELVREYDNKIPDVLVGDPVRLHQIILNLVSNAVKFTSKGKITVSVKLINENEEKATIEFAISDTGIGITENKIDKIFENFQQASSGTSRLYGGTGLGLAIVKQLVESQGGNIHVKSTIGEGSIFSFQLSFLKTKDAAEFEADLIELDTEIKNIKVLVVEDIALNQLLMKTLLDDFGFERDIAANGKIAIEKLETKTYDIILMDLQMPEMNGFEATEYIRNKMNSKIPIIALTADVTTVDLAKCKAVGMNDYIAKPVDERLLYSKIVGLVKKPPHMKVAGDKTSRGIQPKNFKCIDLEYLNQRTKSNPALMMEMISLYLEQTPTLIHAMKKGLEEKDWVSMHAAVHKMIPSFSIMGISTDFENMAKKVQEYASTQLQGDGISEMVLQLENICVQACKELEEEFKLIKSNIK